MISSRLSKNRGFTLIEILVVISIIALLSSVVFVAVQGARERAIETLVVAQERQIKNALELFYAEHGYYPAESDWEDALQPYINIEEAKRPGVSFDYETICSPEEPCQQYALSGNYTRPGSSNGGGGDGNGQTQNPITVTLIANPTIGQNTTLTWNSYPSGTCTASNNQSNSGWTGLKSSSGNQPITFSQTTTFVLSCSVSGYSSGVDSVTVTFTPPAEPELVTVPDVVGMTESDAETTLVEAGLVKDFTTETYNSDISSGNVISQNPVGGNKVEPGTFVSLVVSLGPEENDGNWNAVIRVNESNYYTNNKSVAYQGASSTDYYAPLPVFFEGWESDVPDIKDAIFEWDFGDNLPNNGSIARSGFNAAHVYENPGNYTARLTIRDRNGNEKSSDFITINVRSRDGFGQIYYVDSINGDDNNPGTAAQPWRTADKAFRGLTLHRWTTAGEDPGPYLPGVQILFRAGQGQEFDVFNQVGINAYARQSDTIRKHGVIIGSYGDLGNPNNESTDLRPRLRYRGSGYFFGARGGASDGLAHFVMRDLILIPGGNRHFWESSGNLNNILFKNIKIRELAGGFILTHATSGDNQASHIFLFDVSIEKANFHHFYSTASRVALIGNKFIDASNHVVYNSYMNVGVVYKNDFIRPAAGRNAFRISGASNNFNLPSGNVYVKNNRFEGWIDPRKETDYLSPCKCEGGGCLPAPIGSRTCPFMNGSRYNWQLVLVGPNTGDPGDHQSIKNIIFENNEILNAETLVTVGASSDVIFFNNKLSSVNSNSVGELIMFGGKHNFDYRPVVNVDFSNNRIIVNPTNTPSSKPNIFYVRKCGSPDLSNCPSNQWSGPNNHQDIKLSGNRICWNRSEPTLFTLSKDVPDSVISININNQIISGLSTCQ